MRNRFVVHLQSRVSSERFQWGILAGILLLTSLAWAHPISRSISSVDSDDWNFDTDFVMAETADPEVGGSGSDSLATTNRGDSLPLHGPQGSRLLHEFEDYTDVAQSPAFIRSVQAHKRKREEAKNRSSNMTPICLQFFGAHNCLPTLMGVPEQAVGFTSYYHTPVHWPGSIINGSALPADGVGFHQKENSRSRSFGTEHLVRFVKYLGQQYSKYLDQKDSSKLSSDVLVIGDLSKENGGPFFKYDSSGRIIRNANGEYDLGHLGHESGLDVDIGYILSNSTRLGTDKFSATVPTMSLTKNLQLLYLAFKTGWVQLVISHPKVKNAMCKMAAKEADPRPFAPILKSMLAKENHYDHFHFRLKCPISSPDCMPQPPKDHSYGCPEFAKRMRAISAKP